MVCHGKRSKWWNKQPVVLRKSPGLRGAHFILSREGICHIICPPRMFLGNCVRIYQNACEYMIEVMVGVADHDLHFIGHHTWVNLTWIELNEYELNRMNLNWIESYVNVCNMMMQRYDMLKSIMSWPSG